MALITQMGRHYDTHGRKLNHSSKWRESFISAASKSNQQNFNCISKENRNKLYNLYESYCLCTAITDCWDMGKNTFSRMHEWMEERKKV